MRRRWLLGLGLLVAMPAVGFVVAQAMGARPLESIGHLIGEAQPPIVVGLLHSRTGPLAISEKSLIDAETLAIEEINARGGIGGGGSRPGLPMAARTSRPSSPRLAD